MTVVTTQQRAEKTKFDSENVTYGRMQMRFQNRNGRYRRAELRFRYFAGKLYTDRHDV